MMVLSKFDREVEVDDLTMNRIRRNGEIGINFFEMPCSVSGSGPENHLCFLVGNNGIGDDIHAMPAVKQKIDNGYCVDVYGKNFTRQCYESLGCNFFDEKDISIGFDRANKDRYGMVYHLSQWCMKHDNDSEGFPSIDRFQQFARYIDSSLPTSFDWLQYLQPKKRVTKPYTLLSLHATSIHRSYTKAQELYESFDHQGISYIAFGDSPNEMKSLSFQGMIDMVYNASLVVAVDTGTLALALALKKPVVSLFGPTGSEIIVDQYARYIPIEHTPLRTKKSYHQCMQPCNWNHTKGYTNNLWCKEFAHCMLDIEIEDVITTIKRLL